MMDNLGDDDAGETSAVKSKIQPPDQETAAHEACGQYPYRDWCRACVGGAGLSDAHKATAGKTKQSTCGKHGLWGSSLMDRSQRRETTESTPS